MALTTPLGFLTRVVALWAAVAAPLSYGIFVQAGQILHAQRLSQVELQGSRCLMRAHGLLNDVLTPGPSAASSSKNRHRDLIVFESAGCSRGVEDWSLLRSRLGHVRGSKTDGRRLAIALVTIINKIATDSSLSYDPNPVILNLANAAGYDLPKAQSLIVAAAGVSDALDSARLEATANQLFFFTRYDVVTATSYAPELASTLTIPIQRSLLSQRSYFAKLEVWQKRPTVRAWTKVIPAEHRALDDTEVVNRFIYRALFSELTAEISNGTLQLRSVRLTIARWANLKANYLSSKIWFQSLRCPCD